MSVDSAVSDIAGRLDALPLRPLHLLTAFISALGLFIDIAELSLNGVFSTSFPDRMTSVPVWAQPVLLGSVFAGGIIGAPVFGIIADRGGRRLALLASMAIVSLCSIAAALTADVWLLIVFRFGAGIALGAYPPLMTAWLTDILPPSWRGRIILWADALGFLGAPALVFAIYHLNTRPAFAGTHGFEAWRLTLVVLAAIACLCSLGFAFLPESPRWLALNERVEAARRALRRFDAMATLTEVDRVDAVTQTDGGRPIAPVGADSGQVRRHTGLILVLYALRAVPTVVFPVMMGLVLRRKGIDFNTSLLLVAASSFGGTIGTVCASAMIEYVERRTALWGFGVLLIVAGIVFAAADTAAILLASAASFLTLGAIFGPILSIYAAEILPTAVRASVTATGWGLTRLISSILPVALLPLLAGAGPWPFMGVVLGSIVLSLAVIAGFGPRQPPRRAII